MTVAESRTEMSASRVVEVASSPVHPGHVRPSWFQEGRTRTLGPVQSANQQPVPGFAHLGTMLGGGPSRRGKLRSDADVFPANLRTHSRWDESNCVNVKHSQPRLQDKGSDNSHRSHPHHPNNSFTDHVHTIKRIHTMSDIKEPGFKVS